MIIVHHLYCFKYWYQRCSLRHVVVRNGHKYNLAATCWIIYLLPSVKSGIYRLGTFCPGALLSFIGPVMFALLSLVYLFCLLTWVFWIALDVADHFIKWLTFFFHGCIRRSFPSINIQRLAQYRGSRDPLTILLYTICTFFDPPPDFAVILDLVCTRFGNSFPVRWKRENYQITACKSGMQVWCLRMSKINTRTGCPHPTLLICSHLRGKFPSGVPGTVDIVACRSTMFNTIQIVCIIIHWRLILCVSCFTTYTRP